MLDSHSQFHHLIGQHCHTNKMQLDDLSDLIDIHYLKLKINHRML
jgi:hypothetical protein